MHLVQWQILLDIKLLLKQQIVLEDFLLVFKKILFSSNSLSFFFIKIGQITAAGKSPPAKILVIGGGVAGLSAIGTARNMVLIYSFFFILYFILLSS